MEFTDEQKKKAEILFKKYMHAYKNTGRLDIILYKCTKLCPFLDIVWKKIIDYKTSKDNLRLRKVYVVLDCITALGEDKRWYIVGKPSTEIGQEGSREYLKKLFQRN